MTRLLLILLAASFALTMLAAVSTDTTAARRAMLPQTPGQGGAAQAVTRHAPAAPAGLPVRFVSV